MFSLHMFIKQGKGFPCKFHHTHLKEYKEKKFIFFAYPLYYPLLHFLLPWCVHLLHFCVFFSGLLRIILKVQKI